MRKRRYDIDDPDIPYKKAFEPTLEVGMLVTLKSMEENHATNIPFWKNKNHGIVKNVGWSLCDWTEDGLSSNPDDWYVVPFIDLVWDDGDETHTSQNAVIILSEVK